MFPINHHSTMIGDIKKKKKSITTIGNAANYISDLDFCFGPISFIPSTLGNNSASKPKKVVISSALRYFQKEKLNKKEAAI